MCDTSRAESTENVPSEESSITIEDEVEDGKNKHLVTCKFCPSNILNPGSGVYDRGEFDLPKMGRKKKQHEDESSQSINYEQLTHFWRVQDTYTFENMGFSNTIGEIKYLACADCDIGPIGYYDINSKISYVALARVKHENL